MSSIDELFNKLDEIDIDVDSELNKPLEQAKQQRIEAIIRERLHRETSDVVTDIPLLKRRKKVSRSKLIAIMIAATLLLGMTALAAEHREWDIAIVNFMGIDNADTVQLKSGVVEIGAASTSNGISMKAVTSVGDKNSAYIRIDTDYKFSKDFNKQTDYIIVGDFSSKLTKDKSDYNANHGTTMMYYDNNGYLSFMLYISNCEDINRKNVKLELKDLYLYHDLYTEDMEQAASPTLLHSGEWSLSWDYNYQSKIRSYYPMRRIESNGEVYLVTKLEMSPITLRAEAIKNPTVGSTENSKLIIRRIRMKDGSVIEFDPNSTSGGCRNNMFLNGYRDVMEMGRVIDPSEIYSITIGETEIIL